MTIVVTADEGRYDRQERITWWDQDLLASARALVVGAGALGNEIVKNLTLIGIGSIVVIDIDTIEMSNLARCVFFREGDDGAPKAATLARRATELNPHIDIIGLQRDIRSLGTGIAFRADVMVGALDNREARLTLNRLAWRANRPWVDGAIEALNGVARVFHPGSSCYECTLTESDFAAIAHRQSCRLLSIDELEAGKVPTTATTASIVAGLQVQEVVKLLHARAGNTKPTDGGYCIDGTNNDAYTIRYPFDDNCLAHHTFDDPIEIEYNDTLTFHDVLAATQFDHGLIELADNHVESWRCAACDETTKCGRPATLITTRDAACPTCNVPRQPMLVTQIEVPSDRASTPITSLGVRPDEVLAVRQGIEYRYVWVKQVDADLPELWNA